MNKIKARAVNGGLLVEGYFVWLDKPYIIPDKREFMEKISKNRKIDLDRVIGRSRIQIDPNTIEWPHEDLGRVRSEAINEYKRLMKRRYVKQVESLNDIFPKGMYTKDSRGELVGINVMMKKTLRELLELQRLDFINQSTIVCDNIDKSNEPQSLTDQEFDFFQDRMEEYRRKSKNKCHLVCEGCDSNCKNIEEAKQDLTFDEWQEYLTEKAKEAGIDVDMSSGVAKQYSKAQYRYLQSMESASELIFPQTKPLEREKVRDFEDCEGQECYEGDICTSNIDGEVKEGYIYYCDLHLRWTLKLFEDHETYPLNDIGVYNTKRNIHDNKEK